MLLYLVYGLFFLNQNNMLSQTSLNRVSHYILEVLEKHLSHNRIFSCRGVTHDCGLLPSCGADLFLVFFFFVEDVSKYFPCSWRRRLLLKVFQEDKHLT